MDEGIKAGEEEQRHHGTQGHHVVELRFQDATCVNFYPCAIVGIVQGICIWSRISETAGEVLWRNNTTIFWLLNICNTVTIYHFKKKTTNRLWVIQYVICAIVLNQSRLGGKKKKIYICTEPQHTLLQMSPPKKCIVTMVAVMKKFHGRSVPSPRMKKIIHTALYLSRQTQLDTPANSQLQVWS